MREMHWTYAELEATPAEVRTYVWDAIRRERAAQDAAARRAARKQQHPAGATVREY